MAVRRHMYDMPFMETVKEIQHPVLGSMVPLETPMLCETWGDLDWLMRTWQEVYALEWKISRIPYDLPPNRANPDLIGHVEV